MTVALPPDIHRDLLTYPSLLRNAGFLMEVVSREW
ncbi:hypothetical protein [Komagataeibacter europaeus]